MSLPTVTVPFDARLIFATHNPHKAGEVRAILASALSGFRPEHMVTSGEVGAPEPVEDGASFEENALIKARALAASTGLLAIADDSGIVVDVMGEAPGIFSARWAGRHGDDAANLDLLLKQLAEVRPEHRGAAFVCAAAAVHPDGRESVRVGRLRGVIVPVPRGVNGFGYDPVFVADGQSLTNAELDPDKKNAISHRGLAFRELAKELPGLLD